MSTVNCFKRLFSVIIMTVFVSSNCGFTVYTEKAAASGPIDAWHIGYDLNKKSDVSITYDSKDKSKYVIKIENKDYNDTFIERTYSVKPNTQYKFSALVKYEGYKGDPVGKYDTGANLCKRASGTITPSTFVNSSSDKWTRLEYTFDSGDDAEIKMLLRNGYHKSNCKGTAYFSNIKLEEIVVGKLTNEWNVLAVIIRNVDATAVTSDGEKKKIKYSFTDSEIIREKKIIGKMKTIFPEYSNNQIKIKNLDIITMNETIYQLDKHMLDHSVETIDINNTKVRAFVDKYIEKTGKSYNQIMVFCPDVGRDVNYAYGYNNSTTKYKWIANTSCVFVDRNALINDVAQNDIENQAKANLELVPVHEMIHSIEHNSIELIGDKTPGLDDYSEYNYGPDSTMGKDLRQWYKDFLRSSKKPFKNGKGLDPKAFYVPCEIKYKNITGKMKVDSGITVNK